MRDCCQFESPKISERALFLACKHFIRTFKDFLKVWSREYALQISSQSSGCYPSFPDSHCAEPVFERECVRGSFDANFYASPQRLHCRFQLSAILIHNSASVSGVIRVLVIASQFSDINSTLTIAQIKQNWFGAVASYYHELSYGALTVTGDVYGWYTLPYPESHYGMNCNGINSPDCSGQDESWELAQDAATLAQASANPPVFSNYDYFIFIHSGYGQESSGGTNDIWSVTYMSGIYLKTTTKSISLFSIVPELESSGASAGGVYCLEFGHDLGLPDLYDTNTGKTILGPWELMDKGAWNGNPPGSSPAHMTAWGKIQLGYISGPTLATVQDGTTSTYKVDPTEDRVN